MKGMGEAMDLVAVMETRVVVAVEHTTKSGKPKILDKCTLPLSGTKCISSINTERGSERAFSRTSQQNVEFFTNLQDIIHDVKDNSSICVGGFCLCGIPENLFRATQEKNSKDLTVYTSTAMIPGVGMGLLIDNKQLKRIVTTYIGENKEMENQYLSGQTEVELTPMGTLVEKMRAGGAGIPGFYVPTGYGTLVHKGGIPIKYSKDGKVIESSKPKEEKTINGRNYILEESIKSDFAFIKGYISDKYGNIVFRKSAGNFNRAAAKAGKVCIVEVEDIVDQPLDPEFIDLPSVYVHRVIKGPTYLKTIERVKTIEDLKNQQANLSKRDKSIEVIARRIVIEFKDGMYVNLGIGLGIMSSNFIPPDMLVHLQSENGILRMGPNPPKNEIDSDLISAGKETCSILPGGSFFSADDSFGMIRGGHLNLTVLGAFQVSKFGDIANYIIPGVKIKGMGGAMDLVAPKETRVVVAMEHTSKSGKPKILEKCTLPLTGAKCISAIITERAVFEIDHEKGMTLIEVAKGFTVDDIKKCTEAKFEVSPNCREMQQVADPR